MIHAEYIRDLHSNYMVIKGIEGFQINYRMKILLNNTIDGLLKTELRCIDTMDLFYYNITDKKTINCIYENKSLKYDEIKHFLESILRIIDQSSEYLLSEDDFIIDPNFIFCDSKMQEFKLCYLVGHNNNLLNQLGNLIEFLMNKVDYKDEQAVVLIYALYKEVKESGCSYEQLIQILNGKQEEKLNIKQNTIQDEIQKQSEVESDNSNNSIKNRNIYSANNSDKNNKNSNKNRNFKNDNNKNSNNKINNIKKVSVLNKINANNNGNINNSTRIQEKIKERTQEKANSIGSKIKPDTNIKTKLKNIISIKLMSEFKNKKKNVNKSEIKNKPKNILKNKLSPNKKKENHNSITNYQFPFLEEIENDREVYYYNPFIFILSGLSILLAIFVVVIAINFKVLHNSFGTKLDVTKTLCFIIIIGLIEFYIQVRLFDKKNRNTKIMTEFEYIEPDLGEYNNEEYINEEYKKEESSNEEYNNEGYSHESKNLNVVHEDNKQEIEIEKTELLWSQDEEDEKTRVLFSFKPDKKEVFELLNPIDNSKVTIDTYPFMIGKMGSIVNMVINDTSVSRYHAKITLEDKDLYITDLGSMNGTYINDRRIQENNQYPISNKDEIKFSNIKYILRKIEI